MIRVYQQYAWIQNSFLPDSSDPTADAPSDKGSINKVTATATTMCIFQMQTETVNKEVDATTHIKVYQIVQECK